MKLSHLVDAEYGNQGIDFKMVPREGFGWMNGALVPLAPNFVLTFVFCHSAAYQVGLSYLSTGMRRAVAACTSPEVFFGNIAIPPPISSQNYASNAGTDPLNLAMDALNLSEPGVSSSFSPPY